MLILGIDPGSRKTGYGIIKINKQHEYIASGYIKIVSDDWAYRLKQIYEDLSAIIEQYKPQQASIEKVFVHKNPNSALKLGQARGAAIVALANMGLPIFEYSPREIKKVVTGTGNAGKQQIQNIIQDLLCLDKVPQQDSADALAIAMCHGFYISSKLCNFYHF